MKSKIEIDRFFQNTLNKELNELDLQRLDIINKYSVMKIVVIDTAVLITGALLFLVLRAAFPDSFGPDLLPIVLFGTMVVSGTATFLIIVARRNLFMKLIPEYRKKIFRKITTFIEPDFNYRPDSGISKKDFQKLSVFHKAEGHEATDLIEGKWKDADMAVSFIKSFDTVARKDSSSSNSRESVHFNGLYGKITLSVAIPEPVYIRWRTIFSEAPVITTNNAKFDEDYGIYCKDQNLAKQFVNSKLLQCLVEFTAKSEQPVDYCLTQKELHVAINHINLYALAPSSSFIEDSFAAVYINCINELTGLQEEVSKITAL